MAAISQRSRSKSPSVESCDEEDLVRALDCLETTAEFELAAQAAAAATAAATTVSQGHPSRSALLSTGSACSLAEELEMAKSGELAELPMTTPVLRDVCRNPAARCTAGEDSSCQHQSSATGHVRSRDGARNSDSEASAARRIQSAWRRHRVSTSSVTSTSSFDDDGSAGTRENPFSSIGSRPGSSATVTDDPKHLSRIQSSGAETSSLFTEAESPMSPMDPTYHMATVAAQLCTLDSHEKHMEELTHDMPSSDDGTEDELNGSEDMSSAYKAKLLAPNMQICFTRKNDIDPSLQLPGTSGGRESRGAADGASSGSPVGTDDENAEVVKPLKVRQAVVTKTASSDSTLSRASVEGAVHPRFTSPHHPASAPSASSTNGSRSEGSRQRPNQVFNERLLSSLSLLHLQSLREEFENEVRLMSEELVLQLTQRDALVLKREEYNRLFRQYSKLQKEPVYNQDSSITRPTSFQPPTEAAKTPTGNGILSKTLWRAKKR